MKLFFPQFNILRRRFTLMQRNHESAVAIDGLFILPGGALLCSDPSRQRHLSDKNIIIGLQNYLHLACCCHAGTPEDWQSHVFLLKLDFEAKYGN